jgi:hypothetical protein
MPPKSRVSSRRREHYDEVLDDWIKFLKRGPAHLRANVKLYISRQVTPEMYTSALTRKAARVDAYLFTSDSTRTGHILQTPSESSLYALVDARYRKALADAIPLFRVWPVSWCSAYLRRFGILALGLLLIGVAIGLNWGHQRETGMALLIGAAVNFITFHFTSRPPKEIYE